MMAKKNAAKKKRPAIAKRRERKKRPAVAKKRERKKRPTVAKMLERKKGATVAKKRQRKKIPKRSTTRTITIITSRSELAAAAVALERHALRSEFAARAEGCLDQEVATSLVFSCTGVGAVSPAVKLGQLFPGPVQRQGFCGCVFNKARMAGSSVAPGDIPCGAASTIGNVIDSISC